MDEKTIERFEKVESQLIGFLAEFQTLSKTKAGDAVNKFKLKYLNSVLAEANAILPEKARPFSDFAQFDADDVPTNSDVVIMLRQYRDCMGRVRESETFVKLGLWYWRVDGGGATQRSTRDPDRIG